MSDQDFPSAEYDAWKTDAPEPSGPYCTGCGESKETAVRCDLGEFHCDNCGGTDWAVE